MIPINPARDNLVLDTLGNGRLVDVDTWTVEWFHDEGGGSSHEVRAWIAGFAVATALPSATRRFK